MSRNPVITVAAKALLSEGRSTAMRRHITLLVCSAALLLTLSCALTGATRQPAESPTKLSATLAQATATATPEQALLTLIDLMVKSEEYDPGEDLLHVYRNALAPDRQGSTFTIAIEKPIPTPEEFVDVGFDLLLLTSLLSAEADWNLGHIEVISPGPESSSAALVLRGDDIERVADGEVSVSDVADIEIDWGNLPADKPTAQPVVTAGAPAAPPVQPNSTLVLESRTTMSEATCRVSVWGNGIQFFLDAAPGHPASREVAPGEYGWQAFIGDLQTSGGSIDLLAGDQCKFVCTDTHVELSCSR
jgi:hypothetical protein